MLTTCMPTVFCSIIMPLGTNDTWAKCNILSSGSFLFQLLFSHNSRSMSRSNMTFLTNKAGDKCYTSILCNFDCKIHLLYYARDLTSSSRSKGEFLGKTVQNRIVNKSN